jgi:protein-tyrosine phosphatase
MPNVIFICTANICRSPMAEKFFQQQLEQHGLAANYHVSSAGTWAQEGLPADRIVSRIVEEQYGLSLQEHRSKEVNKELLAEQDLILVMEKNQREALQIEFAEKQKKIFLLSEMVGQEFDIADPHRQTEQDYQKAAQQIYQIITVGFPEILKRANQDGE